MTVGMVALLGERVVFARSARRVSGLRLHGRRPALRLVLALGTPLRSQTHLVVVGGTALAAFFAARAVAQTVARTRSDRRLGESRSRTTRVERRRCLRRRRRRRERPVIGRREPVARILRGMKDRDRFVPRRRRRGQAVRRLVGRRTSGHGGKGGDLSGGRRLRRGRRVTGVRGRGVLRRPSSLQSEA